MDKILSEQIFLVSSKDDLFRIINNQEGDESNEVLNKAS